MAVSFEFHQRLYCGESMDEKKLDKIKKRLCSSRLFPKYSGSDVYLLLPAANPEDQLDILNAKQLIQPYYAGRRLLVTGVAADYGEALQLVERMVQDCLRERGDCNLREYMKC